MLQSRAIKARDIIKKHGLDAMLFTDMKNIRYLSGFTGTDAALFVTANDVYFMTDSRYVTQADQQVDCVIKEYQKKIDGISALIASVDCCSKIGVEGHNFSVSDFNELKAKCDPPANFYIIENSSAIRSVKDESELERIRKSAEISRQALEEVVPLIQPGISERDIALELEFATRRCGSEVKAFDFIVASGVRGAMPHGVASEKIIEQGDLVTIDFGSCYQGYYSDETVNFAVGDVTPELRKIHDIVLKAHDLAVEKIKPGVFLSNIDKIARDFISNKGYGDFFGHGLGHGVGLDVHEWPRVSSQSKVCAEIGMVFTVEPGIYVPGLGGVRIEDMIVVTETGCRCLTDLPKNLRQL